ncbi:MAG: hypothetical protein ACXAEU_03435 [Candidatus Hodarchaeales archaeon]|jgi:hypothetical protein
MSRSVIGNYVDDVLWILLVLACKNLDMLSLDDPLQVEMSSLFGR